MIIIIIVVVMTMVIVVVVMMMIVIVVMMKIRVMVVTMMKMVVVAVMFVAMSTIRGQFHNLPHKANHYHGLFVNGQLPTECCILYSIIEFKWIILLCIPLYLITIPCIATMLGKFFSLVKSCSIKH